MLGNQANDLVNEFINFKSKSVYVPHEHEINSFVNDITNNNNLNSLDNNLIKSLHNTDLMMSNHLKDKTKDNRKENNDI